MIKLRRKVIRDSDGATTPEILQWSCPFNLQVIGSGPRRGEIVIVAYPPGTTVGWSDIPRVEVAVDDPDQDVALRIPEVNKVIVPQGVGGPNG